MLVSVKSILPYLQTLIQVHKLCTLALNSGSVADFRHKH